MSRIAPAGRRGSKFVSGGLKWSQFQRFWLCQSSTSRPCGRHPQARLPGNASQKPMREPNRTDWLTKPDRFRSPGPRCRQPIQLHPAVPKLCRNGICFDPQGLPCRKRKLIPDVNVWTLANTEGASFGGHFAAPQARRRWIESSSANHFCFNSQAGRFSPNWGMKVLNPTKNGPI